MTTLMRQAIVRFSFLFLIAGVLLADLPATASLACGLPNKVLATARLSWLDQVGNFIVGSTQEYWACADNGADVRSTMQPESIGGIPVGGWSLTIAFDDKLNRSCTTMSIFPPGTPQAFSLRCDLPEKKNRGAVFSFGAVAP